VKILFVGGAVDGQWIPVDHNLGWHRIETSVPMGIIPVNATREGVVEALKSKTHLTEAYRRMAWEVGDAIFQVFVLSSLPDAAVVSKLIAHYHPPIVEVKE
jgi:hypothetical protein